MTPHYLLSTASLYLSSLGRTFALARGAGFDGVELSLTPASARTSPQQIAALAREMDLSVASLHPPTIPLPGWADTPDTFRRLARWAPALPGCQVVVLHTPDALSQTDPRMTRFCHILDALQQELAGTPVRIGLENRNRRPGEPLGPLDPPDRLVAFCRQHDCHIVLDTAHAHTMPFPLLETYHTVRELLVNVHLSDVRPIGRWSRFSYLRSIFSHHRVPGQGILPLAALFEAMQQDRYAGWITLELSPLALRFWCPSQTRRLLRQARQTCGQWAGRNSC